MAELRLISEAFAAGSPIPSRYTCEGEDLSPPLAWSGIPSGAVSLALICDDPDAPSGTFVHWVAWGIDPSVGGLAEDEAAPHEGANGFGTTGYRGPCPPPGHGPHRYFFHLSALSNEPSIEPGAGSDALKHAIDGCVLAAAELVGTYERS
jgi:Raf kinase inhibitor-like YbhB/YbcL family protein